MEIYKKILYACITLILLSNCEITEEKIIDVETGILNEMDRMRIPSVVACIIKNDHIVWEGTFGYSNVETNIPATRETIYSLMSVSKLFLATAVMQLWEKGLIDFEEDINAYLPFHVRNPYYPGEKITPHMLLNHTSGLAWPEEEDRVPDFYHFYPDNEVPLLRDWLPEYILTGGSKYHSDVWKDFPPGEKELYSNIATSLLALIVEEISGEDFRDYCVEHIIHPLQMYNSSYRFIHYMREDLATPYFHNNQPLTPYILRHYPAGSLNTNIEDLSHFVITILNQGEYMGKQIIKPETIEKMLEVQNPESGIANLWWYSIGNSFGHDGGGTGFRTMMEIFPDQNMGLIILSNKRNESVAPGGRIYELVRYQCSRY
jgi:CubicO group peptidase (beta-lactamase class C family)